MPYNIHFFAEDITFVLPNTQYTAAWLRDVATHEQHTLKRINYIFCSDTYLHKLNVSYLQHDTFTDVLTFDHATNSQHLEADSYISIHRVSDNAHTLQQSFLTELHRVMVHSILHLVGYQDKHPSQAAQIHAREDYYLAQRTTCLLDGGNEKM